MKSRPVVLLSNTLNKGADDCLEEHAQKSIAHTAERNNITPLPLNRIIEVLKLLHKYCKPAPNIKLNVGLSPAKYYSPGKGQENHCFGETKDNPCFLFLNAEYLLPYLLFADRTLEIQPS